MPREGRESGGEERQKDRGRVMAGATGTAKKDQSFDGKVGKKGRKKERKKWVLGGRGREGGKLDI